MDKKLNEALKIIFNQNYDLSDPKPQLLNLVPPRSLYVVKKHQIIIEQNTPAKFFYLLLSGNASVLNSITWATNNVVDTVHPLDILGLVEYLNRIPTYTAYVVALEDCYVLKVPVEKFSKAIQQDVSLCYNTLQIFARVASDNMNRAEVKALLHPKETLEYYLFLQAQANGIPYTLPITKKLLSEKLHINLRTLYRYCSSLEIDGILKLINGKVIIDSENFEILSERYGDIVL